MSRNNFDWHSDDEAIWDEEPQQPERVVRRRLRLWSTLLLTAVFLGAAGWLVSSQLQQRVAVATSRVESDVLASHDLVLEAAAGSDGELLRSLLSGRDDAWVDAQEELANAGSLFDRSLLGLHLEPTTSPPPTIALNPELTSAEVVFSRDYQVVNAAGDAETVTLQHTAVYRRGSQRWLYAPPEDEFWGNWVSSRGQSLTLHYLSREDPWASRLASDLESLLHEMCRTFADLVCPGEMHLELFLEREAAALDAFLDPTYSWQTEQWSLTLPTLTLVGTPVDEAGYQAIYRAYGAQVATAALTTLVEYECCERAPIMQQALIDYQLFQLGLQPWQVSQQDFWAVFAVQPKIDSLLADWFESGPESLQADDRYAAYALVDFLFSDDLPVPQSAPPAQVTPVRLQRTLSLSNSSRDWVANSFAEWSVWGSTIRIMSYLEEAWWRYAQAQVLAAVPAPPVPLPDQDLLLSCEVVDDDWVGTERTSVMRYNLETETLTEVRQLPGFGFVSVLPDDATFLFNYTDLESRTWRVDLQRDGNAVAVAPNDGFALSLGQLDPQGRWLTIFSDSSSAGGLQAMLVDLTACHEGACDPAAVQGIPYWSPEGSHAIVTEQDDGSMLFRVVQPVNGRYVMLDPPKEEAAQLTSTLWLATDPTQPDSMVEVGTGAAPFWIDEETFGYLQFKPNSQDLAMATIHDVEPTILLTLADVRPFLPAEVRESSQLQLGYAYTDPALRIPLIVVVYNVAESIAYILSYDTRSEIVTFLLEVSYGFNHASSLSPNGNLIVNGWSEEDTRFGPVSVLFTIDPGTGEVYKNFLGDTIGFLGSAEYDWSADGRWMAFQMGRDKIGLTVPGSDYLRLLTHSGHNCFTVSWVEREE